MTALPWEIHAHEKLRYDFLRNKRSCRFLDDDDIVLPVTLTEKAVNAVLYWG